MVDQRSVEKLEFNSASRNFACRSLAQGLSRSVTVFLSFMREYFDPAVKTDQCAQYVNNIGIAAKFRAVLQCIRQAGLKLTIEKYPFQVGQVEFLVRTISSKGVSQQTHNIENLLEQIDSPQIEKSFAAQSGV